MSDGQRALWVVPVAELGGVARHVLDATRVGIPGWSLTVLCPEGALAERLRAQGSAVVTAPVGPGAGMLASKRTLERVARQLHPAIVHSHLAYADIITAWSRLPRGTRRFTTEHGIAGDDSVYHRSGLHARVMAMVHRLRFPKFDGVIAVSRATRDAMISKWLVKQSITVIHNGVDGSSDIVPEPHTIDRSTAKFLSLSRLSPEKRIDVAVAAFELVHAEIPGATFVIAGEGPQRDDLYAEIERRGLAPAVTLPGFVNPAAAMAQADVMLQLTIWENCSYTLLDAVARGMNIVASDVGGNPEIVPEHALVRDVTPASVARAMLESVTQSVAEKEAAVPPGSIQGMCAHIAHAYAERRCAV